MPGAAFSASADDIAAGDQESFESAVDLQMSRKIDPLEKIAKLDRISKRLRKQRLMFLDGSWKLTTFYSAIVHQMPNGVKDPLIALWKERYPNSPTPYIIEYKLELQRLLGDRVWALVSLKQATQTSSADQASIAALRQDLLANKVKVSVDPEWYAIWSRLALLSEHDDTTFINMSLEGIKREPTYGPQYDAAADYFLPKWGGSSIALDQWARTVSKETSGVPGSFAYVRTYSRAIAVQYGNSIFRDSRIAWGDFKADIPKYLARYPATRNIAQFTRAACLAGDREETQSLIKRNPKSSYLGEFLSREDSEACVEWAKRPPPDSPSFDLRQRDKAI